MVKIVIENLGKKELTVNDLSLSVLQHIHAHFIDWMHACGGKGRCTTCKMIIVRGRENTSPLSAAEQEYRKQKALGESDRLSCQTRISGDVVIRVPDEYKFRHLKYSE